MFTPRNRFLRLACIGALAGTCFQFSGCLGDVQHFVANFNPCGTILYCDPVLYRFVTSGYDGPGADPDIDPACTFPPFCGESDPFAPVVWAP